MSPDELSLVYSTRSCAKDSFYVTTCTSLSPCESKVILETLSKHLRSPVVCFDDLEENIRPFRWGETHGVSIQRSEFPLLNTILSMHFFLYMQADLMPDGSECARSCDYPRDPLRPFPTRAYKWSGNAVANALYVGAHRRLSEVYMETMREICSRIGILMDNHSHSTDSAR